LYSVYFSVRLQQTAAQYLYVLARHYFWKDSVLTRSLLQHLPYVHLHDDHRHEGVVPYPGVDVRVTRARAGSCGCHDAYLVDLHWWGFARFRGNGPGTKYLSGYTIPRPSMIGALRWITWINPLRYGFAAVMGTYNSTCVSPMSFNGLFVESQ
jgi:hypothetical protein